jgi:predicted dehydrogenase
VTSEFLFCIFEKLRKNPVCSATQTTDRRPTEGLLLDPGWAAAEPPAAASSPRAAEAAPGCTKARCPYPTQAQSPASTAVAAAPRAAAKNHEMAATEEGQPPLCNWGIMGCANIARKNARCMLQAPNARVVAVSSRSLAKAQAWTEAHALTGAEALEGYDTLLARADVHAVYIPLPTTLHLEWVVKAAQAGKHCLVEKPVAVNAQELATMLRACEDNGVQFMDGVMFMHHKRMQKIEKVLRGDPYNAFGDVQRVTSGFTFSGDPAFFEGNIRASAQGDPLGCLGDLGWYCIRFGLFAFGYDCAPVSVSARKIRDASEFSGGEGVPVDMEVSVFFDEKKRKTLSFHCSFCHPFRQWIEVCGSNHTLHLDDFVLAKNQSNATFDVERNGGLMDIDCMVSTVVETVSTLDCVQELEMIKTFSSLALGEKVPGPCWSEVSMATQKVIDAAMASAAADGIIVPV